MITTDMTFYNPYTKIYTIVVYESNVRPSGMIETSNTFYYNIKESYYQWDNPFTFFRIILEGMFLCILFLYTFLEINTILRVIFQKIKN